MPAGDPKMNCSAEARDGAVPLPFELPPPPGRTVAPVWTGGGFAIGQSFEKVLSYDAGDSAWTDDLTAFHEETAGGGHYIDRASREHTIESLLRHIPSRRGTIMDIGCSSGLMVRALKEKFPEATVIGADYIVGPLQRLANDLPSTPLLQFNLINCPLPDRSLDAVVLLNVLEHIEDDAAAMRQVARILKPGGVAVVEVPAGSELYDIYDKQLMHFRRYDMSELEAMVTLSGLEVVERSHLGFFLYPAFWIAKRRGQRHMTETHEFQRQQVAKSIRVGKSSVLLGRVLRLESALRSKVYYPFGIRCLVTCRSLHLP